MRIVNLVLLPGMDGTGELFEPFTDILPSSVNALVIPLLQEIGASYQAQARYVASKIHGPSIIVAESYSGMVALALVKEFPEKVEKIVFVASFLSSPSRLSKLAGNIPQPIIKLAKEPNWLLEKLLFGRGDKQYLRQKFKQVMSSISPALIQFRLRQISSIGAPEVESTVPSLYLLANQDILVSKSVVAIFIDTFKNVIVNELDGTHFLLQTNPKGAWRAIQAFVETPE